MKIDLTQPLMFAIQKQIVVGLISTILGLAYIHLVPIAQTGLDQSWQIALTKAHFEGKLWGTDIIFTYGPLSYLFFGSLLGKTFFEMQISRFFLSFFWIFTSLNFSFKTKNNLIRWISLIAFIAIPSLFNNPEIKFILIIQILIVSAATSSKNDSKPTWSRIQSYLYGVMSIVFFLIKFNFGLLSVVCYVAIALCNWLAARLANVESEKNGSPFRLAWLLFGYVTGLIIFFSPLINQPYLAFLFAFLPGIFLAFILARRFNELSDAMISKYPSLALSLLIITLITTHQQIRAFIISSLEITKGYSQSMTTMGNTNELIVGCLLLTGIIFLGVLATFSNIRNVGSVIALLIFALISFKHGFIRHGGHVLNFAFTAPAYMASLGTLILSHGSNRLRSIAKFVWLFFVVVAVTFVIGLGIDGSGLSKYYTFTPIQPILDLDLQKLTQKISALTQPQIAEAELLMQKDQSLYSSRIFSSRILRVLQGKTVDVQPWEVSLTEANNLKWHPAPTFQAYTAYTRWLDRKNLKAYQTDSPDRILYSFMSIDFRHPYFDQPQTNLFIRCQYEAQRILEPLSLRSTGDLAVLRKRKNPICDSEAISALGQPIAATWHQTVDLDQFREKVSGPGHILILKLNIRYSLLGKIYNTLYRTPIVELVAQYKSGQVQKYRLVIDTAQAGIVVGDLPTKLEEVLKDLSGQDNSNSVQSITVQTLNSRVFAKTIEMSFWDLKKAPQLPDNFNPKKYLRINPDLKAAGVDPKKHYMESGFFEGRRYR
jgi:hypothetical protein